MKKIVIMAIMAVLPLFASAQKFASVNLSEIFALMPETKAAETELEQYQKQIMEELQYMETEFQKKMDDYNKNYESLTTEIRTRREKELDDIRRQYQEYAQSSEVSLGQKRQELMNTVQTKLMNAVKSVGEEGGYICVFDVSSGVVPFVSTTLTTDVNAAVKSKLGIK